MSGGLDVFSGQIASEPTTLDIEATMMVYASALQLGAPRDEFILEGLVSP